MTNVPGPSTPLYLAGAKIKQIMFWVPQSGDIGMGVSILSYNEMVQFGLITDAEMTPDPEAIIAHFRPKFEQLLYYVLMSPWDGDEAKAAEKAVLDAPAASAAAASVRKPRSKPAKKAKAASDAAAAPEIKSIARKKPAASEPRTRAAASKPAVAAAPAPKPAPRRKLPRK
jgi:hypothetical protein